MAEQDTEKDPRQDAAPDLDADADAEPVDVPFPTHFRADRWRRAGASQDEIVVLAAEAAVQPEVARMHDAGRIDSVSDSDLREHLEARREQGTLKPPAPEAAIHEQAKAEHDRPAVSGEAGAGGIPPSAGPPIAPTGKQ